VHAARRTTEIPVGASGFFETSASMAVFIDFLLSRKIERGVY
jgi:hypothetical protein